METEARPAGGETEFQRRTTRRSRIGITLVAVVLAGAIGLTVIDMVGQSDRERARVVGGVTRASTAARDFGYVPALIVAQEGTQLRITIHNQGVHTHTFTVDSLGVDEVIDRGQTRVLTLQLPRTGRFRFYCRFHQQYGMRGTIVVPSS